MLLLKKLVPLIAIVALMSISGVVSEDNDTTIETTTQTSTTTTTEITTTTTTEPQTTTTTSTTTEPTTTTTEAPPVDPIFNFTIFNNKSEPCLRLKFSLAFDITYTAEFNNSKYNSTVAVKLDNYKDYNGTCDDKENTFTLKFDVNKDEWQLTLGYTLKDKSEYSLDTMSVNYVANPEIFGNITKEDAGKPFQAKGSNLDQFQASAGNSFKCTAKTKFAVDDKLQVEFKNYQGQPFIINTKSKDFDTAIECPADTSGTSKLVPIIVGSSLAVLVILVLIAYIVGRHKHRNGYQTV